MPPKKRRQSIFGEDGKDPGDRLTTDAAAEGDSCKGTRSSKSGDSANPVDKRLTARQQSKQDAESAAEKQREKEAASTAESSTKQPTRFSTRIVKRPRRDFSPPESPIKRVKKTATPVPVSTPETKGKRQWELWSVEDKDSFFEGLCEFGKDFESIHNLIVTKCRKKGSVMPVTVKNKEQVRHFYYRTWHKISKLIQPVEDLKKDIQELYGLIGYSVLRKKLRGGINPNDKNWQKLNELVHQGAATIKVKGKRIRVKTPVCNALKKLNNYEEPKHEPGPKVPEKIHVEFRPKTNMAWKHVQDLSHNPRLRITVKPERYLQSLIEFMDVKWKSHRLKSKETLGVREEPHQELRVYPHRDSVVTCINLEAINEPVLQFSLSKHARNPATSSPSGGKRRKDKEVSNKSNVAATPVIETESGKSVIQDRKCEDTGKEKQCSCKDSHVTDPSAVGVDTDLKLNQCSCGKVAAASKSDKSEESMKNVPGSQVRSPVSLFSAISESENIECSNRKNPRATNCGSVQNAKGQVVDMEETSAVISGTRRVSGAELNAIVDGENAMFPDPVQVTTAGNTEGCEDDDETVAADSVPQKSGTAPQEPEVERSGTDSVVEKDGDSNMSGGSGHSDVEQICRDIMTQGWCSRDEENVTLAELYLMFGQNSELKFEYEWVSLKTEAQLLQEKLLNNLNNMLRRLSHLAMVEFTDFSKSAGVDSTCQLCGQSQGPRQKGKDKSPAGKVRSGRSSRDVAVQTQLPVLLNKEVPMNEITGKPLPGEGVFREPSISSQMAGQQKQLVTLAHKDIVQKMNPPIAKPPIMRPRKLKTVSRVRTGPTGFGQRTILPKNSQLLALYPVVANQQLPGQTDKQVVSQTIVGHPLSGIQPQPIPTPKPVSTAVSTQASTQPYGNKTPEKSITLLASSTSTPTTSSTTTTTGSSIGVVEMSPEDGDQTLMRIPASHVGSMSPASLKAAGLSTVPGTPKRPQISPPNTSSSVSVSSASVSKCSLSPPNLSALLDISFSNIDTVSNSGKFMDLETDTTFSGLLEDANKTVEPGLTTPPIRSSDAPRLSPLHSPPVRSLFQSSPPPDNQWLNAEVPDLSLSSFLESPSKPSVSSLSTQNNNLFSSTLPSALFSESSRDSQSHKIDVDSTLHCMMNESSIDYVKKFADLAEQIVQGDAAVSTSSKPS